MVGGIIATPVEFDSLIAAVQYIKPILAQQLDKATRNVQARTVAVNSHVVDVGFTKTKRPTATFVNIQRGVVRP